jgi:hypothetical protein
MNEWTSGGRSPNRKVEICEAMRRKGRGWPDGRRGRRMMERRGGMKNVTWSAKRGEEKPKGKTDGKEKHGPRARRPRDRAPQSYAEMRRKARAAVDKQMPAKEKAKQRRNGTRWTLFGRSENTRSKRPTEKDTID